MSGLVWDAPDVRASTCRNISFLLINSHSPPYCLSIYKAISTAHFKSHFPEYWFQEWKILSWVLIICCQTPTGWHITQFPWILNPLKGTCSLQSFLVHLITSTSSFSFCISYLYSISISLWLCPSLSLPLFLSLFDCFSLLVFPPLSLSLSLSHSFSLFLFDSVHLSHFLSFCHSLTASLY